MLRSILIKNFRCYSEHEIDFKKLTIIVGKNNAGKSTLIEALRLISLVTTRYQGLNFSPPPKWLEIPQNHRGVSPSIKGLEFSQNNLFNHYGEPPSKITAIFKNSYKIELYIGPEAEMHAVLYNKDGSILQTKGQTKNIKFPAIEILPQIGPLLLNEDTIGQDYVKANLSSSLASRHFRNQLNVLYYKFNDFKKITEETWPSLRIIELGGRSNLSGSKLSLLIQDNSFVAEAAWMGHGLQMWIQTMWFLARCSKRSTIILDEPDVYMHADLQRKLIRFLKNRFDQVIIATHSIEIMSEVEPDEILVIDRQKTKSNYTSNLPAVQNIIHVIGSVGFPFLELVKSINFV